MCPEAQSDLYRLWIPVIFIDFISPLHSALYWYYAFINKLSSPLYCKFLEGKDYI